jgi:large repetitive protein
MAHQDDTADELRHIGREIHRIHDDLVALLLIPSEFDQFKKELAMSAITELKALGVRVDAVTALLPVDIATAVATQKAADATALTAAQDALSALQASDAADATALEAEITTLTAKIAALETAAGVQPPVTGNLSVTPTSITGVAGAAVTQALTVTGGTGPYTTAIDPAAPAPPSDVTLAGNTITVGGLVAETGSVSVIATDSSSPPLTSPSTPISISIAVSRTGPAPGVVTISPTNISGPVGGPITQLLVASGGSAPYTFEIDPAAPPPPADVTLGTDGTVSIGGQAVETGSIAVIATDANRVSSASTPISISVA